VTRPAIAGLRLSLTHSGDVRYQVKTPYLDGTTHVVFESLDCMARLAALVWRPRVDPTRYHGVIAPICPLARTAPGAGRSHRAGGAGARARYIPVSRNPFPSAVRRCPGRSVSSACSGSIPGAARLAAGRSRWLPASTPGGDPEDSAASILPSRRA
jgi:hypothetical protein